MDKKRIKCIKSITTKVMGLALGLSAMIAICLGGLGRLFLSQSMTQAIDNHKSSMNSGYNREIKSEVQSAISIIEGFYSRFEKGEMSEDEAKDLAKEAVRSMRYRDDQSGYMWIDGTNYTLVMHPILTDQEGDNRYELTDQNGVKIIQVIMDVAQKGGGYNTFEFTKADGVTIAPKIAYSEMFEPWQWVVTTGNYVDDIEIEVNIVGKRIEKQFDSLIIIFGIASIIIIIAALTISMFFGERLTKGIKKFEKDLQKAAVGDFTFEIDEEVLRREDEIGEMARSLERVQHSLIKMIGNVSNASTQLYESSERFNEKFESITEGIQSINDAVEELAQGAMEQTSETEIVHMKVQELEEVIRVEQEETGKLQKVVDAMLCYSNQMANHMEILDQMTEVTVDAIEMVSEQTHRTNDSATHINKVIELIKRIAEQTNLLSLNASIEAARAGESGKGFSIVAREIRNLAEESANNAKEIEEMIQQVIENIENSTHKMKQVTNNVKEQQSQLSESKNAFRKLYNEIKIVGEVAEEIGDQTDVLEVLKEAVSISVNGLVGTVEENIAATEQTNASMQVLADSVEQCMKDTTDLLLLSEKQNEEAQKFKL